MNDLVILHLSDLHIDDTAHSYSKLLHGLIRDIEKEIVYIQNKSMVIAITGDTIHQGSKKAVPNAIKFFQALYQVTKDKVVGIYIVPGNHDKFRTVENKMLIPAYRMMYSQCKQAFDEKFYNTFWKYQLNTYNSETGSGYLELTKSIYDIFGIDEKPQYLEDTFGVNITEIFGKKFCFVMLNTSWSCIGEEENRKLLLGQFQIDKIQKQYGNLIDELDEANPYLTIVLGHHPIGCLYGEEEDRIFSHMISSEELNACAYLCGHTHDRTVINWSNNHHSINTFMTGIGWPKSNSYYHADPHTYSMYVFNLDANSIDIYVKSTDDAGNFSPDFRIYTNTVNKDGNKIVFPIKSEEAQTFIPLSTGPNRSFKAYYISNLFINSIQEYVLRMGLLRQNLGAMIEADKNEFYENIPIDFESDVSYDEIMFNYLFANLGIEEEPEEIDSESQAILDNLFTITTDIRYNMFLGFLQKVCQRFAHILLHDKILPNEVVRFHFRYLSDRNTFLYSKLCTSFTDITLSDEYELSDIKYGELIEAAYKEKKALIYSINKGFCQNELKDKWANFLTVIPLFDGNIFRRRYSELVFKEIPFITFGITTNSAKFDSLLYCMDYFSINIMLEELINSYIRIFQINTDKFCMWFKNELKKEDTP